VHVGRSSEQPDSVLDETKVQEAPFERTTIGNILVSDSKMGTAVVSEENLQALQGLLILQPHFLE